MPAAILKPHILGIKNRILKRGQKGFALRDSLAFIVTIFLVIGTYQGCYSFFLALSKHPNFEYSLFIKLIGISLFAFSMLLLFSNSIAALGYLFTAKDIPMLLYMPVSTLRIYFARLTETICTSSWIFIVFFIPIICATQSAFDLPRTFYFVAFAAIIPFLIIPAAIGTIFVTLFVNLIPPHRIRDILVGIAFLIMFSVLLLTNQDAPVIDTQSKNLSHLLGYLEKLNRPLPQWLPSTWTAKVLGSYLSNDTNFPAKELLLLISSAIISVFFGALFFVSFFHRGFSISAHSKKRPKAYSSKFSGLPLFILPPQLRGFVVKEFKMFIRDTTQSLQLIMLLLLTFIYLWNFRSLRVVPNFSAESMTWWKVILAVSNTAFGACVISAIATRFVFPCISLEGRAYHLIRSTPIGIGRIIHYKFFTWLWPVMTLCLVLLLSGSFAIDANTKTIFATIFIAISMAIGITGLAIGIGAVYGRFDWEAPTQVTASFGSLVFMLVALALILSTMLPVAFLFILTTVDSFSQEMSELDHAIGVVGSCFLIAFLNVVAAKRAMHAGKQKLQEAEM